MHKVPLLVALLCTATAARADSASEEVDDCLACHKRPDLEIKLATGELFSLRVDEKALRASSHKKLACTDCHADLKGVEGEHPKRPLPSKREFAIANSAACKKCHFSNYAGVLDGVHGARIAGGKLDGAVCSDCHGAHDITPAGEPRSKISRTCATCHAAITLAYANSVHGKSLAASESEDVPTCTDCHRSHDIKDPRAGAWRAGSPDLCGKCHADAKKMEKYGLSPAVLQTYLADFHGATAKLQQGDPSAQPVVALCTDCHGAHAIARMKGTDPQLIKQNLLASCRKCHPDARADFPASWLSHYEPSLAKTPLVWLIKVAYLIFIPFMIGGLALQLVLHLWRLAVNR
jgi:predicted CXXCH cytochrome family protein